MLHPAIKQTEKSGIHERGLVATAPIKAGEIVWHLDKKDEQRMTADEVAKLPPEQFDLVYQAGENEFIMLLDESEVLNHSCDPNLWWSDDETLVARRDIEPGEELTYDYSSSDIDLKTFPGFTCHCGAANCRGYVSWKDSQDPDWQQIHRGHLPSWTEKHLDILSPRL